MSVPKWRRSSSKLDAFFEAVKLRHIVTQMIMRTFGMKTKYKHVVSDKLYEDYPELAKLFDKMNRYQEVVEETRELKAYDDWMIRRVRTNLFNYCADMVKHISAANEIRCTTAQEYIKRILLEDDAICDVANIKQEVQFVEEFFNIDLNKYMNYADQIEKVKNYLYRWKRSTVKDYEKFLEEQKAKEQANQEKEGQKAESAGEGE